MTCAAAVGILEHVHLRATAGLRRLAAFGFVGLCGVATLLRADADVTSRHDTSDAPVIRIVGQRGDITVRTWDRNFIQVDSKSPDDSIDEQVGTMRFGTDPRSIPISAQIAERADRPIILPPEDFVVANVSPGAHENIVVRTHFATTIITVPATTSLLVVTSSAGTITVDGYRGSFVVISRNANIAMHNMGGAGFVQTIFGTLGFSDSTLDRIRARTGTRALRFERCNVRQIEATSIFGNVVYDAGTFSPGLARFTSQAGNVAIGIASGGVAIGAHSPNGRVFSAFARGANIAGGAGDTTATINGGGPLVTATTDRGSVYLYDGALRLKRNLSADWIHPLRALNAPADEPPATPAPLRLRAPAAAPRDTDPPRLPPIHQPPRPPVEHPPGTPHLAPLDR